MLDHLPGIGRRRAAVPGRGAFLAGAGHRGRVPHDRDAPHQDARLTSAQIEVIRTVLTPCSQVLYWAERHGGARFHTALAAAEARSAGRLRYDVSLAIDYLDFAPAAARRTR